jgi:hypothetical protein
MTESLLNQHNRSDFTSPFAKRARLDSNGQYSIRDMLPVSTSEQAGSRNTLIDSSEQSTLKSSCPSSSRGMLDISIPLPVEHSLLGSTSAGENFLHDTGSSNFDSQAFELTEFSESSSYANRVAPTSNYSANSSASTFTLAFPRREVCFGMVRFSSNSCLFQTFDVGGARR